MRTATFVVLMLAVTVHAAELAPLEQRVAAEVDRRQPQALRLLERAVAINSGTLNPAGVKQVGELFDAALAELGFETRWIDGAGFDRAGHLVAEHAGSGPHLLLIGHLDTVFEPDSTFQRYQRLDTDHARGPGVIDMKGGNVIIVEALAALRAVDALDDLRITVVMTGDEEASGRPLSLARKALLDAAEDADVALGFEDGDGNPETAVIARRGYTGWRLEVSATPAHSSLIFRDAVGAGAVFEAARILDTFRSELAGERYLTFNPGVMLAGTRVDYDAANSVGEAFGKANVIAEHATVEGDLRTLSADQLESVKARMVEIVSDHLPGASAEIAFDDGYPPLAPASGNRKLLSLYDQVSRDLGFGPVTAVDPSAAGAADISFTAGHVEMALDGLGLMGSGGHTVHETADLRTLPSQTKRAALLMYRLRDLR
jgi:glutamate carboxypeptidase